MRSSNPALSEQIFRDAAFTLDDPDRMTLQGTVYKSGVLLTLTFASAVATWMLFFAAGPAAVMPLAIGGSFGGFIIAMAIIWNKTWAPWASPIYALVKGVAVGGISASVQTQFPDTPIVLQAAMLTFTTFAGLLMAYTSGLIQATENFKLGVTAATLGIFGLYLVTFVLGFVGVSVPFIHSTGLLGIGVSVFIVIIAALNLVLDFDFIENGAEQGAPKYMEWYAAFGLLVTLIWLYFEFLRLLAKLNSRRN
jgi:uncharacterized YccA/Bax inhibitor family protein